MSSSTEMTEAMPWSLVPNQDIAHRVHGSKNARRPRCWCCFERIEKLEEERKAIGGDIKDVYSEAKGVGYDVKTMRKIISMRAMDAADRAEQETLLDVYKHALGMI